MGPMTVRDTTREPEGSAARLVGAWRRHLRFWDAGYAAVALVVLIALVADPGGAPWPAATGVALVVVGLASGYARWGRPAVEGRPGTHRWGYLVGGWAGFLLAVALVPDGPGWLLLTALFPQTWMILAARPAIVVTLAVTTLATIFTAGRGPGGSTSPAGVAVIAAAMTGLSIGLGLFITWLSGEASTRAALLDELAAAREEVARAHRREGMSAERDRVAREIHDTLAQGFTAIIAWSDAARSALARGDAQRAGGHLEAIEKAARDNLAETRMLVAEGSAALAGRTLPQALARLVETIAANSGIRGEFRCVGDAPEGTTPEHDVLLVRAAQEALANTRRHSGARAFSVSLTRGSDETLLVVADDGVGFDPACDRRGFGLDGLAARARDCGAALDIGSAPDAGTRLTLRVPV